MLKPPFYLLLISALILSACNKDYSAETGQLLGGTAGYSFITADSKFVGVDINGIYQKGAFLTSGDSVNIYVNVTRIGSYIISSPIQNGLIFSVTGNFTHLGNQFVTLIGNGIPINSGVFKFTPYFNIYAFAINISPRNNPDNSSIYYEAIIDGVFYTQNVSDTTKYIYGTGKDGVNDVALSSTIGPSLSTYVPNSTAMFISKGTLHNYSNTTNELFKSFFNSGDYPLAITNTITGGIIGWTDPTGKYWSSNKGIGKQRASNVLTIISVVEAPQLQGYYLKIVTQFNCTLYDDDGHTKNLVNGKYVGYVNRS